MAAGGLVVARTVVGLLELAGGVDALVLHAHGPDARTASGEDQVDGVDDVSVAVVGQLAVGALRGAAGDGQVSVHEQAQPVEGLLDRGAPLQPDAAGVLAAAQGVVHRVGGLGQVAVTGRAPEGQRPVGEVVYAGLFAP